MHKKTARDIDVNGAETILWNGAPGVAKMPNFTKGTNTIIDILVERTRAGATTILVVETQPPLSKREQPAR